MSKRHYKKSDLFPEGIDRLDAGLLLPVTGKQLASLLDENFRGGNMKQTVGYIILKHGLWKEAMGLGIGEDDRTAFRATWALEWAYEQGGDELPEWFAGHMLEDFTLSRNGSLHRVYAKMLYDLIRFGGYAPDAIQGEKLAAKCFDLLIDRSVKTAVKAWCIQLLLYLSERLPWVAEPLKDTVGQISEDPVCSRGMAVVCRGVLKALER